MPEVKLNLPDNLKKKVFIHEYTNLKINNDIKLNLNDTNDNEINDNEINDNETNDNETNDNDNDNDKIQQLNDKNINHNKR